MPNTVVLGAGIVGSAAVWDLVRRGHAVTVADADSDADADGEDGGTGAHLVVELTTSCDYGLAHVDPETIFSTGDLAGPANEPLRKIIARLRDTYSRTIGVEYTFLEKREARNWLRDRMELTGNHIDVDQTVGLS